MIILGLAGLIFWLLGNLGVTYCLLVGHMLMSLYCFLVVRVRKMSAAEKILSYSLSGIFMLAAAREVVEFIQDSKIIALSPEVIIVDSILHWIAFISFLFMAVDWIKNRKKPSK